ncbi:MAG TPA: DsbA family protein [Acidimicrobiales bacterium]|nr:DsbA family protein [Acidimicrobiales bacterium]
MTAYRFDITYDYRCPWARNMHEHVVAALKAGAEWDVTFLPFSLNQAHVEEGGTPVWDNPEAGPALLAGLVSLVVRDEYPDAFLDAHHALFSARHDKQLDTRDPAVISEALASVGLDEAKILAAAPERNEQFREIHTRAVSEHQVFGVPTFIVGDAATFVRLRSRPDADNPAASIGVVERVLALMTEWPELNEFKWTSIPR